MLDSLPNAQSQSRIHANSDFLAFVGRFSPVGRKTTYLKKESTILPCVLSVSKGRLKARVRKFYDYSKEAEARATDVELSENYAIRKSDADECGGTRTN